MSTLNNAQQDGQTFRHHLITHIMLNFNRPTLMTRAPIIGSTILNNKQFASFRYKTHHIVNFQDSS